MSAADLVAAYLPAKYGAIQTHANAAMLGAQAQMVGATGAAARDTATANRTTAETQRGVLRPVGGGELGTGTGAPPAIPDPYNPDEDSSGYAKGTSNVKGGKGKGKGMVPSKGRDAVSGDGGGPGMVKSGLAPGEAVLTPGAAEHFGRNNVGMLNMLSNHGMLSSQQPHLGGQNQRRDEEYGLEDMGIGMPGAGKGQRGSSGTM